MAKNEKMKQCRKAAGMSQTDLAKAADVTRQTIGMIESGNSTHPSACASGSAGR